VVTTVREFRFRRSWNKIYRQEMRHFLSLTRARRLVPTGPIMNPIIPILRKEPFVDPAWLFELKLDGFRALADTIAGAP
jgi:ATP-dependent DNA ligase